MQVRGFGGQILQCVWPEAALGNDGSGSTASKTGGDDAWYRGLLSRLKNLFFANDSALPRAPPSMANPSFLLGQVVEPRTTSSSFKTSPTSTAASPGGSASS